MDFLRRILGLSSNSSTDVLAPTSDEEIHITHQGEATESPETPPEPFIETPAPEDAVEMSAASASTQDQVATAPLGMDQDEVDVETSKAEAMPVGTRPLPPFERYAPQPGQRVIFGQLSNVGMVRGNNQDAVFSMLSAGTSIDDLPDFGLFVVADGMGGHQEGERASAITTRIVAKYVLNEIFLILLNQQMNDPDRPPIASVLSTAVQEANESVTAEIPEGGTTVTTAVILGDLAYIAHVGDSRAYLITDDKIEQITRDHSLVQRLIELDQLTPEEAVEHPQRNVLYRAIGQSESLDVDAITRRLPPSAHLLLCSDGLWNMVDEETILEYIAKYDNPQVVCNELVNIANERGGPDNITVILIRMPG